MLGLVSLGLCQETVGVRATGAKSWRFGKRSGTYFQQNNKFFSHSSVSFWSPDTKLNPRLEERLGDTRRSSAWGGGANIQGTGLQIFPVRQTSI